MKVTREELVTHIEERRIGRRRERAAGRGFELVSLLAGSLVILSGLVLVWLAKTHDAPADAANTIHLNQLTGPQQLIPLLTGIGGSPADQEFIANRIYNLKRHGETFSNVGALARLRITRQDLASHRGLSAIPTRLGDRDGPIPLLGPGEFAKLKPFFRVRDVNEFERSLMIWAGLFILSFYVLHAALRFRRFTGNQFLLPAIHLLSGLGFLLMISLRDPLRDTLMFADFTQGVIAGCLAMYLLVIPDYERQMSRLSFVPLLGALLLAIALGLFGTGPGASDAKVNLLFFQPVEVIRILLVLFLAGYFANNWDALRHLHQTSTKNPWISRYFRMPRLDYVLPVAAGVIVSLLLFFWLNDLGPALVIGCLFLAMYSVARNRVQLAAAGLAVIIMGFAGGYFLGYPHAVRERVEMWRSPWDNHVRGGGQVADSLWSLSTGGTTGTGLGLGDPQTVPAAHTDLIVTALGEQLGLLGVVALLLLYALLAYQSLRIALKASGAYSFFLVLGLTLIIVFQTLLIIGGLTGLIPLSGVVTPFLSYGRTSMVMNFALFGIILAVSGRSSTRDHGPNFGRGVRTLTIILGGLALVVVVRFAWIQTVNADNILARGTLVLQADGVRRYQYNPRLIQVAREIPKGTIFDRNGIPLASSDWAQIEKHRADYQRLGAILEQTTSKNDKRHYPLGAPMFYLLGDVRSRLKQGATNTAFQEGASRIRLQGYDDVQEFEQSQDSETGEMSTRVRRDLRVLIPLLRHRYEPEHPAVRAILDRPRDVRMSIDAGLQLRATEILKRHLEKLGKPKGALVVIDPATGDLLAAVSSPWPTQTQFASLSSTSQAPLPGNDFLDRARFGLYPPGSSFKIVTAIAALRKDPALDRQHFDCVRLPDGRIGNMVHKREIRDDVKDTQPHGTVDLHKGIVVSCNAFFAQFGVNSVGSKALYDTASKLGISVARPNTAAQLQQYLPQASYGQAQVVASPFQMARVAATIANGGKMPQGRWIVDETNSRVRQPEELLSSPLAQVIAKAMRDAVTSGTGRAVNGGGVPIAGKTGTAELAGAASHAWFIGFAPYGQAGGKQIAFAVLVENGQYGGSSAAPIAGELVAAARELGLL